MLLYHHATTGGQAQVRPYWVQIWPGTLAAQPSQLPPMRALCTFEVIAPVGAVSCCSMSDNHSLYKSVHILYTVYECLQQLHVRDQSQPRCASESVT